MSTISIILVALGSFSIFYGYRNYQQGVLVEESIVDYNEYEIRAMVDPFYGRALLFICTGVFLVLTSTIIELWRLV